MCPCSPVRWGHELCKMVYAPRRLSAASDAQGQPVPPFPGELPQMRFVPHACYQRVFRGIRHDRCLPVLSALPLPRETANELNHATRIVPVIRVDPCEPVPHAGSVVKNRVKASPCLLQQTANTKKRLRTMPRLCSLPAPVPLRTLRWQITLLAPWRLCFALACLRALTQVAKFPRELS
jgi:hypothetical protein